MHPHFITCTVLHWIPLQLMIEKINYIHNNPIKRGYVDEAKHWRYSSARDYEDSNGLIEIERIW